MEHIRINENIRLESVKLSMSEEIFTTIQSNREYLARWLPFVNMTKEVSDTEKFLKSIIIQPGEQKDNIYSIYYKEEFAGLIGFKDTDWINKKTELGYWISEKMQGKGLITLSAKKLIRYAFNKLTLNRVQIKVAVGNSKSAAIPKNLGFTFEGIERAGEKHDNQFLDLEVYSLLKIDLSY
jgi:ribosomal-protein-serine acetyltransferase